MSDELKSPRKVNPRYRAYGRARIDAAQRIQSQSDWQRLWKPAQYAFPFVWGEHWKCSIEYQVDDFAAEIGFLIDVVGLPVNAFNPGIAMFTSPDHDFFFAVVPTPPGAVCTPPGALRIQFMVDDIFATHEEFLRRGVVFEHEPQPVAAGSLQWVATFLTPNGISIEIWGQVEMVQDEPSEPAEEETAKEELETSSEDRHSTAQEWEQPDDEEPETSHPPARPSVEPAPNLRPTGQSNPAAAQTRPGQTPSRPAEQIPPRNAVPEKTPILRPTSPVTNNRPTPPGGPLKPASSPTIKPPPPPQKPLPVFKSGKEMLDHLQQKTAQNANQNNQAALTTFRPAPKPAAVEKPVSDEGLEYEDLDSESPSKNLYNPISFDSSEEDL